MILTGEHYGALSFSSLDEFYPLQREAAAAILTGVHAVAVKSVETVGRRRDTVEARPYGRPGSDDFERPHHAFVIDGERGTGKTTLLLTLEKFLGAMTLDCGRRHPAIAHDSLVLEQLASLGLRAPPGSSGAERVALALPIVFMEDMEATETTMEAVFAQMDGVLEREHVRADAARKEVLGKLRDDLRREVGVAWTYSRRIGSEALSNDALDYTDFVVRRAKHNRQAYDRIQTWHGYVTRYLDELGFRTLVLMFDDSDLNPAAAEDILGAIRMYLSHPRIVSVMAVEMATLQRTVFSRNLASLGKTPIRLLDFDAGAAQDMVDGARRNAAALLDKILPVNLRHRLLDVDMRHLDHFFRECAKGGVGGYTNWCVRRFEVAVDPQVKLAWFMLAKPYRRLVADNVRRIVAFKDEAGGDGRNPVSWLVRNHGTHALPMSDGLDLHELETRIEAGEIGSGWKDVEGEDGEDGALVPTDRDLTFIEFWLDLAIAGQHLDVVGSELIRHWLPSRGVLGSEASLVDDGKRSLGVAGILRDIPLPRSCLYLHQFRRLSGVALHPLPDPTRWANWLAFTSRDLDREAVAQAAGDVAHGTSSNPANVSGWLRSQAVLMATSDTYRKPASLGRPAMEFVVGLYALMKAGLDATGFAAVLSTFDEDEDPFADAPLRPHADLDDFEAFVSTLSVAFTEGERMRQEALFAWACALDIAAIGDDDQPPRPSPRRQLAVSFAATSSSSRLPDLIRLTVDRMSTGGRHALLLAWSLGPLLPVLHGFGGDYGERSGGTLQAWQKLSDAFRLLRATVSPFPERRAATARSPDDPRGRATPVAGSWEYPEFTRATLDEIVADIVNTTRRFKHDLRPEQAAGTERIEESSQDPIGALASVLGMSKRWVAQNVVRA